MENSMENPQKQTNKQKQQQKKNPKKQKLPDDTAIPLLGIYPKNTKTLSQKDICTARFIVALFTIAKIWNQLKCPSMDEWIKMLCICIYTQEYYWAIKRWNLAIFDTMDGPMLNEISQINTTWFYSCIEYKKK